MSTDGSTNTSGQTPKQEVLERAVENFPTLQFPRMVALVHLAKSMAAGRARVKDSHTLQQRKLAETLGYDPPEDETVPEEHDEGMFSVSGDTTINLPQEQPATNSSGGGRGLPDWLLPGLLGAGALWLFLGQNPDGKTTTDSTTTETTVKEKKELELIFYDKDGNVITVDRVPPELLKGKGGHR